MKKFYAFFSILLFPILIFAQINYHDIIPDKLVQRSNQPDTFKIDIDNDFVNDIGVYNYVTNSTYPPTWKEGVISYSNNLSFAIYNNYTAVNNLYDTIKNCLTWNSGDEILAYFLNGLWSGNWVNGKYDKFLGVRKIEGSDTLYGYVRLSMPGTWTETEVIVHDYAMESIPNTSIYAGQGIGYSANNISVSDVGDQMNGDDLFISFDKAIDESFVSSYRVMVVPSYLATTFNLDSALLVPVSSYIEVSPSGTDYILVNGSTNLDVTGQSIADLKPYKVFVLTIPDGINSTEYLLSAPSPEIELRALAPVVSYVLGVDVGDNNNASDVTICFGRINCETCIKNYRLYIVKNSLANSFNVESALQLPFTYYLDVDTNLFNPCLPLPSVLYDIDGEPVHNGQSYRFFIMTVPDTIHNDYPSLSPPSNLFMLQTPNIFITGSMNGSIFTDVDPDLTVNGYPPGTETYIDLNKDGIDDFYFFNYSYQHLSAYIYRYEIVSLNSNQFLLSDSLHFDLPVLNPYELLYDDQIWSGGIGNLYYHSWYMGSYEITHGYWSSVNDGFIGVRIIENNDTLYGWINLSFSGGWTLKSYAIYSPNSVQAITMEDVDDQNNGNDLSVSFTKAVDESTVSSYRVMVVPSGQAGTFSKDSAIMVPTSNYKTIIPGGTDTTFVFGNIINDVNGNAIENLVSYKVFVLSVPDGIFSTDYAISKSFSDIILHSYTQTVTNIMAEDIGDNNAGDDIEICFDRISCESCIKNYRLFIVNNIEADSFTIDLALTIASANYLNFDTTLLYPCLNLPSIVYDIDGNLVQNGVSYRFFIMSVPDTIHTNTPTLSGPSNLFQLQTPDIFISGDTLNCIYNNILPDTTIIPVQGNQTYYYVDLNNDSINDFLLSCYTYSNSQSSYVDIYRLNNNQILDYNPLDQYLPVLSSKLLLFDEQSWSNTNGRLCATFYGINYGYWADVNDGYIGVRIFHNNDTLYGWINVGVIGTSTLTIKSYALYDPKVNVPENYSFQTNFSIYPNPVYDIIEIKCNGFNKRNLNCMVYNSVGCLIYSKKVQYDKFQIDLSHLSTGVYLIKMDDGVNSLTRKFVKSKL